ncbi:MAG: hypothetical protein JWN68_1447 [Nocardioides sp.]|jgi:hypothetical protein|uniref:hypothetical protein n=1 Tax=Nocardioides sp. TaxID=35761 RepID=UPI0026381534|nr:hypothetical protein [Nocardioides sp.]MCW2833494.1 hypothetical protein [Nocardioides sp.]
MAGFAAVVYTIGTALRRAQDEDMAVEILVAGEWMAGRVSATDGQGVMLLGANGELSIVRLAGVDAVRVPDAAAFAGRSPDE